MESSKLTANLGLIAAVLGIAGGAWTANDFWHEIKDLDLKMQTLHSEMKTLRSEMSSVDSKLSGMRSESTRFEKLKMNMQGIVDQFAAQESRIGKVQTEAEDTRKSFSSEAVKLNEKVNKLQNSLEEISSGAVVRHVSCIELGERIVVEAGKSYDFCNTKWTLQLTQIGMDGVAMGRSGLGVPSIYKGGLVPDGCELQFLESIKKDKNDFNVEIRGYCDG